MNLREIYLAGHVLPLFSNTRTHFQGKKKGTKNMSLPLKRNLNFTTILQLYNVFLLIFKY